MALQNVTVEVAFTATPFADPSTLTWTDVSSYAESWSTHRGRADEQSQMQAGTATVSLQNTDGRFDPDNGSSPYSPNLLPGVPIRISTTFSATKYYLFWGFVEAWEQHYDAMVPTVNVTASDGLKAILGYSVGLGYTETLVSDYGGTIGSQFDLVWPWQGVNTFNSYLNSAVAQVADSGASHPSGIAETGLQLSGSSSYLYWLTGMIGAALYWLGIDAWFRIDAVPGAGSVSKCLFACANSTNSNVTPNLGYGPMTTAAGDVMSAYVVNYPQNILAANPADPTSTTGWSVSGTGAMIATATITTSNGLRRIYLDNGATDFYGATKAMRVTMAAGAAAVDLLSPFTNATAGTAYTFQGVMTLEEGGTSTTLKIDWYNGATFISSSTVGALKSVAGVYLLLSKLTAPAGTTRFQWHMTTNAQTGSTTHVDVSQLIAVAGSFDNLIWYAGGTTPVAQLLFNIAAYGGTAPPGQSSSANGWPCYASVNVPAAGDWFHVAIDSGTDNTGTPYSTATATRGLPSLWVNGVAQRLWTTGPPGAGLAFNTFPWASLGARLFYTGVSTPTVNTATSLAMTADEIYIPDANISAVGEVTAAKALAHYSYGLTRHDFDQQLTGARIGEVLDSLGWPPAQRSIDTGTVTLLAQAPDTSGTSLTGTKLLQDAGTAEGGLYFVGRDGKFNFWDQSHAMGGSPVLIIGDGSSDVHYMGWPVIRKDDTHIFNLVQLTQSVTDNSGATAAVVQVADTVSQDRYNVRALPISAPWANVSDMQTIAAATLADYKNPASRVASIAVEGVTSNAFASLLPRDIGDYVEAHLIPDNYTGPAVTLSAFIQGIQISGAQNRSWIFTFSLSPTIAGH